MDPFTTAIRALIGKKMVDSAKSAYAEASGSINKAISDWDAALKASSNNSKNKNTAKANADAVANLFEKNGTLNTDPLASKKSGSRENSDYEQLVNIAEKAGYEPTDAKIDSILGQLRNNDANPEGAKTESAAPAVTTTTEDDSDVITYTYKPGDTFGQVLLNLGLSDGSKLWGAGGDVEYYTQQLIDQNMLDSRGNVKLGIPFKLRRRK